MASSIRWRLQWWHGAILGATLLGFGAMMYWSVRQSWFRELDTLIEGQIHSLDIHLRRLPPFFLEDGDRSPPPPPPGARPRPPESNPRNIRRIMEELELPADPEPPAGFPPPDPPFFEIRRVDGTVLKSRGLPKDFSELYQNKEIINDPILYFWHPFRIGIMTGPGNTTILVGRGTVSIQNRLDAFALRMWLSGAVAMALGLGGGWVIASGIIKPIERISRNITNIRGSDLSKRISLPELDLEMVGLAENLNEMLERLEESFQIQARFSADASHEMRTPLAAIRSQCEMALRKPRSPNEYVDALKAALRGVSRLEKLVEDLLTLARSEAKKNSENIKPIDLQPILDEAIHDVKDLAKERKINLDFQLFPLVVEGDGPQLEIVFLNLIRNAIVHNHEEGSVQIRTEKRENSVVVEIRDTGKGIPPEDLKHIGERFFRTDVSRSTGGNGLGLAICKRIIQEHKGTLDCESELGKGSIFRVNFPLIVNHTD